MRPEGEDAAARPGGIPIREAAGKRRAVLPPRGQTGTGIGPKCHYATRLRRNNPDGFDEAPQPDNSVCSRRDNPVTPG